jgi:hypothetical protein
MSDNPNNNEQITPPAGNDAPPPEENLNDRVDRLVGEPAPDISAEEFARLQRSGTVNLDAQGRVRANRREEDDAGVSLRKRRAWYTG